MSLHETFNHTGLSRFINSGTGRGFRLFAGIVFLVVGLLFRHHPLGIASLIWSFFPLSAGIFDICWVSAVLGGPMRSCDIRAAKSQG